MGLGKPSSSRVETYKDVKDNKKSFYHYISSRRLNKENMGPLLNGVGYLVTVDTEKAEVHSAFFASAFTYKVSWASGLKSRVQGGEL